MNLRYEVNVDTFRVFYINSKDKLFGYLMRLTGDYQLSSDILQESYTRMLSSYGAGMLNTSLLFKIARNALMDVRRKGKQTREIEDSDLKDDTTPETDMMVLESYRTVMVAMDSLDEMERDLLSMAVSSDFSYREIGEVVGISEGHVRVKIHRARTRLKDILIRGGGER